MTKMTRKFVCIFLSIVMLCTALPLNALAFNPFEDDGMDIAADLFDSDILDRQEQNGDLTPTILNDLNYIMFRMVKHDEYLKATKLAMQVTSGIRAVSGMLSLINGSVNFLKLIGVIEDPEASTLEDIYECVLDIQETVNEINTKTDAIQTTLDAEFSKMDYNFNLSRYDSYQQAWTDFFTQGGSAAKLDELYAAYQSQLNVELLSYAKQWQSGSEFGVRALYNDAIEPILLYTGDNMNGAGYDLPPMPYWSDDCTVDGIKYSCMVADSVTLPGKYIKIEKVKLNADNCTTHLTEALRNGVRTAIDESALIVTNSSFYDNWEMMAEDEKSALCDQLADDLMNSISYDVSHSVANSAKSGEGTFASKVKAAYDVFAKNVAGENSVTSPVTAGFQRLSLTHGFEGEIKDDFTEIIAYISMLNVQYASFASYVCSLDDSMKQDTKAAVSSTNLKAMRAIITQYHSCMTGNDNYCYPLSEVVEYHDVSLRATHTLNFPKRFDDIKQDFGQWNLLDQTVSYPDASDTEAFQNRVSEVEASLQTTMLSIRDISLLYYYYLNHVSETGEDSSFLEYLRGNDAMLPVSADADTETYGHSTQLITTGYSVKDLRFDEGIKLNAYVEDDVYEHLVYEEGKEYEMTSSVNSRGKDNYYNRHADKVVGTLFDISDYSVAGMTNNANVTNRIRQNAVYTARFYSHPVYRITSSEKIHARGSSYDQEYGYFTEHFAFTDGAFTSGKDVLTTDKDGPITSVIEKSMGALVAVPTGTLTIGANVKSVSKGTIHSQNLKQLVINSGETEIAPDAFEGIGTENNRCLLQTYDRGTPSLIEAWNGGYFGNMVIKLKSGNSYRQEKTYVAANGMATKKIPSGIFKAESGKYFSGWDADIVSNGMTALTAKWSDHIHTPTENSQQPTCTENGYTTYSSCTLCGEQLSGSTILPATGHNYSFAMIDGTGTGKCAYCGNKISFECGEFGDFRVAVSGDSLSNAVSYQKADGASHGVLSINSDAIVLIQNKNQRSSTADTIYVKKDVSANVTLDGVKIEITDSAHKNAAFEIAQYSSGQVTLTLAKDSVNILHSGDSFAGVQKNGTSGTLTINGSGSLAAIGGMSGAGIGSSRQLETGNITINDGIIYAASGDGISAGIGASSSLSGFGLTYNQGDAYNIVINGGTVTAGLSSQYPGIGGTKGSLCIRGGTVTSRSPIGRSNTLGGSAFNVTIYSTASVSATSCKDTIYNEKHQPVTCHTVNVNGTEDGKSVSGVVVNGYVLPFIKHMVVTEKGTLKSDSSISNRVYIYGTDDLEVTLNHDGSFISSIFDNSSILLICISAAIVAAGIAAAVIISRKRKKAKKTDETN